MSTGSDRYQDSAEQEVLMLSKELQDTIVHACVMLTKRGGLWGVGRRKFHPHCSALRGLHYNGRHGARRLFYRGCPDTTWRDQS